MLELFGAETGNAYRAAIALHEAELPFVPRVVDLRGGEHRAAAFLALNPAGRIPVLRDTDRPDQPFVLTQSNAIMFHAAARGPKGRLLPVAGAKLTRVLERFFYFLTEAITWSGAAFALARQDPAAAGALEAILLERLEAAERFLADDAYMGGPEFSLADIAGYTIVRAYRQRLDWRADRPLVRWFDRIDARPAVQRGLAAFRPA